QLHFVSTRFAPPSRPSSWACVHATAPTYSARFLSRRGVRGGILFHLSSHYGWCCA
ncbi:hypothetical protein EMIHUDRAFT_367287, partial [Emiliania huxleyi CCMP1516]|uniref:Uncharacterized protein n=2 Tax=Emiliania huxleyi TaxID=2903 RepID=A0A0D3JPV3_EMIH1